MDKYNGLLSKVSQQYCILRGNQETENEWKTRLIYSICGMMAYACLWDDEEEPISMVYLKRRIRSILSGYKSMYPELSIILPYSSEELEDEITNQFLSAGIVYHRPNRIVPSKKREEQFDGILFQRGIALDCISCVSGIGFYSKQDGGTNSINLKTMFCLEQENLQTLWQNTLSTVSWKSNPAFEFNTEYLSLIPPFTHSYWVNDPDKTGAISILRTGMRGSQLYYLYRYVDTVLEVSPLPKWQVENYNYRTLACACLSSYGTLPPIEYAEDGPLVHIHMNYLLPPRELEFLKCYSWPEVCTSLPCNFRRKLSVEVFRAIKDVLSDEGYEFKGGTT